MPDKEQIKENIEAARRKIAEISAASGREPPVLLAATKTIDADSINYAIRECGVTDIGENKVQELLEKYDLYDRSARLHFIGRLQRNKVKYIIDKVDVIDSLDSIPLALEIEKQAAKHDRIIDVYLEINTGREEQKGGFLPEELEEAAVKISLLPHIHITGLMAVAPICEKKEDYSRYFQETYQKFIDISQKKLHNIDMNVLSMGMSDSFEEAVAQGATMVRLGTALFGTRTYQTEDATHKKTRK